MTTNSSTIERLVPAGRIYFDELDSSNSYTGEFYMGATINFSIQIKTDALESYVAEDGALELDDTTLTQTTRTGKLTCRQVSDENLKKFMIADLSTYAQTGASVTNEALSVLPDRYYQLGRTTLNPPGRQNVSALSMTAGDAAVGWVTLTAKALGDYVKGTSTPTYYFKCTTPGTTGATEPTWSNANDPGETITDGTVVWTNMGILIPVVTTDFTLDATLGRLYVLPNARINTSIANPWSCDYTYATNSRKRISTSGLARVNGALHFVANNMKGANRDVYAPNVLLAPSGDAIFKAEKPSYVEMSWDLTFSKGINGEAALYIDGRAA